MFIFTIFLLTYALNESTRKEIRTDLLLDDLFPLNNFTRQADHSLSLTLVEGRGQLQRVTKLLLTD